MPDDSVPILPSRDLRETLEFYQRLGLTCSTASPDDYEGYLMIARGGLRMHFFAHPTLDPSKDAGSCYWYVSDADALYAEFAALGLPAAGIPRIVPIENKPWYMREFAVVDPSGNLVRIGEPIRA
jgi:catechol 2,3-dioxygenase-like lactoylglutathione lyase family enzyme